MSLLHTRAIAPKKQIARNLDNVTRYYTAFLSFAEMCLSATQSNYRPTLYVYAAKTARERRALKFIADYYDQAMAAMRQERRAYRT